MRDKNRCPVHPHVYYTGKQDYCYACNKTKSQIETEQEEYEENLRYKKEREDRMFPYD